MNVLFECVGNTWSPVGGAVCGGLKLELKGVRCCAWASRVFSQPLSYSLLLLCVADNITSQLLLLPSAVPSPHGGLPQKVYSETVRQANPFSFELLFVRIKYLSSRK